MRKQNESPSNISGVMGHLLRGNDWPVGGGCVLLFLMSSQFEGVPQKGNTEEIFLC